jgi:hypothetical protein
MVYGLEIRGIRFRFLADRSDFSLPQIIHAGSDAPSSFLSNRQRRTTEPTTVTDHSRSFSSGVKKNSCVRFGNLTAVNMNNTVVRHVTSWSCQKCRHTGVSEEPTSAGFSEKPVHSVHQGVCLTEAANRLQLNSGNELIHYEI